MPRNSIAGNSYWGESRRLTVRLSDRDVRDLDDLVEQRGIDRSAAIRRAIQQAFAEVARRRRHSLLCAIADMSVADLRALASRLRIKGRGVMKGEELRNAVRGVVQG